LQASGYFPPGIDIRPFGFVWGKHPIDFSGARLHNAPVFMSTHKLMKAIFGKADRSGFHYFVTPGLPMNRTPEAGFDFLGGVIVASLSLGVVLLMRLLLAN
jgi:hypothetical protein